MPPKLFYVQHKIKMRILHTLFSRGFAGTERATAEMCNALCEEHAVLLVLSRRHRDSTGASILDHLSKKIKIVKVNHWFPIFELKKSIHEFQPEIIHTHLRKSTRLIATINPACPSISTLHMWVNGPHFLKMDGLIVIADWQKNGLKKYTGKIFDINESLIPHPRITIKKRNSLRTEAGANEKDFLIGGVGRLAESKGFDTLIKAFIEAKIPNAKLVLIGAGRERAKLEFIARNSAVKFLGFHPYAKDFYQAFDLFVSPSRSEPLGRVIFEALDAETPVLATCTQGPLEILTKFPGVLVPIDDIKKMAAAIKEIAAAPQKRTSVDLTDYHLTTIAAQTLRAYKTLIS